MVQFLVVFYFPGKIVSETFQKAKAHPLFFLLKEEYIRCFFLSFPITLHEFYPLLLLLLINFLRTGLLALSPLGLFSMFGMAVGFLNGAPLPVGTPELRQVVSEIAQPIGPELLVPFRIGDGTAHRLIVVLNDNFRQTAFQLHERFNQDWIASYRLMQEALIPALYASREAYANYLGWGLVAFFTFAWELHLLPLIAVCASFIKGEHKVFARVLLLLWGLHLVRGISVVAITAPCDRYVSATLVPLLFLTVVQILLLAAPRPSLQQLTERNRKLPHIELPPYPP